MGNRINNYAKKTFLAMLNPKKSVCKVFPNKVDYIMENEGYYLGTKDVMNIPLTFIESLEELGYYHHTIDKASHSGRGIDVELQNPITGGHMTGSSSGTALNVFLGINDLGVGTDGGGSVLAPAISLNLFGFIHPDLGKEADAKVEKKVSTDGILFSPSIGFISRDFEHIYKLVTHLFSLEEQLVSSISLCVEENVTEIHSNLMVLSENLQQVSFADKYLKERVDLIQQLQALLEESDVVISKEGPIDVAGFGDTVYGHFDEYTKAEQVKANKGFIRGVNMAGAIALTIPTGELATAYVLICKNNLSDLAKLFKVAKALVGTEDELITRYFGDLSKYFQSGLSL